MKFRVTLLSLFVAVLSGCDGRAKILYLQPATAMKPPWSVASVIIPIKGTEDVAGIVAKVVADLHMQPDQKNTNRWYFRFSDRESFQLSIRKDAGGYWEVCLLDWPSIKRSPQSLKAEQEIRMALTEANQALEHNDPIRHASCCAPVAPTGIVAHL